MLAWPGLESSKPRSGKRFTAGASEDSSPGHPKMESEGIRSGPVQGKHGPPDVVIAKPFGIDCRPSRRVYLNDSPCDRGIGCLIGDRRLDNQKALRLGLDTQTGELAQAKGRMALGGQHQEVASLNLHQGRQAHVVGSPTAVTYLVLAISPVVQYTNPAGDRHRIAMEQVYFSSHKKFHVLPDPGSCALTNLARGIEANDTVGCALAQHLGQKHRTIGRGTT